MYSKIKRGDRKDTGDLEARPKEGVGRAGSGTRTGPNTGKVTGDASALAEGQSPAPSELTGAAGQDLAGLTVHDALDPDLGLTNIGEVPPQDWAADTGETKNQQIDEEPDDRHPAREKQEESD
ncbi:MAG: hypothetical protein JNK87_06510 [Bryobacterales bacterium]|nr:hypothetical protein [Bryobacterales bacterium]